MNVAKYAFEALGNKPSNASTALCPLNPSPRPRTCSHSVEVCDFQPNSGSRKPVHSKVSCFAFLLATFALVFVQLLFNGGVITSYSPVVCDGDATEETKRQLSADSSRVHFPRTKRRLPQCIIIGARKCGTRALLEFLNLHPMIQKATEEIHFFDDETNYDLGLDWYRRKMPYSFPEQITIEKSPAYFITPTVPKRIFAMNSSVRLLLIVRDPVTRLISDYAQLASNKARKERPMATFEELVLRPDGTVNVGYKAVRTSMYSMFFSRWLRTFGRRLIHVVDGDRLVTAPYQEVQKIEKFLGLGHKVKKENFYYNETKGFFCVRNQTSAKCLNESKGRKHPEISPGVVSVLRQFYAPYNKEFYEQAGVNFDWPTH